MHTVKRHTAYWPLLSISMIMGEGREERQMTRTGACFIKWHHVLRPSNDAVGSWNASAWRRSGDNGAIASCRVWRWSGGWNPELLKGRRTQGTALVRFFVDDRGVMQISTRRGKPRETRRRKAASELAPARASPTGDHQLGVSVEARQRLLGDMRAAAVSLGWA